MSARIYLDHNATAPLRPAARDAMVAALDVQANASSVHREGQHARGIVETARASIADMLGCSGESLVMTGSGTEACQLAVMGFAGTAPDACIVASAVEHSATLDGARAAGLDIRTLPVDESGTVRVEALDAALAEPGPGRALVCLMAANNETGVIQPVEQAASIARSHGAAVFCDAVQAFAKVPFDVTALDLDFAAISAHKIGGPQGAGALYVKPGTAIRPSIPGRQERGLRGGTENVASIAGFAAAAMVANAGLMEEGQRLSDLRDRLEQRVREATPDAIVLGERAARLPNTSAIALPGALAEALLIALDLAGVAISAGAACSSGKVGRSHVLEAMGLGQEIEAAAIRVSLGWNTTKDDVDAFVSAWAECARRHRDIAA